MQGAGQWMSALDARRAAPARILFARLGVVAECRPLSPGELGECLEMGGARGARYALYLSCDSLREAGARQVAAREALSPLDITESIAYSDVLAAAGIIARLSGAGPAMVRQLEADETPESALEAGMAGHEAPAEVVSDNPFAAGLSSVSGTGGNPFAAGALAADAAGGKPFGTEARAADVAIDNPFAAPHGVHGREAAAGAARALPADNEAGVQYSADQAAGDGLPPAYGAEASALADKRPSPAARPDSAAHPAWSLGSPPGGAGRGHSAAVAFAGAAETGLPSGASGPETSDLAMPALGAPRGAAGRGGTLSPAGVADSGGGPGQWADAFARILADRLRDAAGNM